MPGEHLHIAFNQQNCPVDGCEVKGSVPGIKRHVKFVHGTEVFASSKFEPLRTRESLKPYTTEELQSFAIHRKLIKADTSIVTRKQLVQALTGSEE